MTTRAAKAVDVYCRGCGYPIHDGPCTWDLYCGNFNCPSRRAGQLFQVEAADMPDGEIWLCPACQAKAEAS
jgi:hypothetical protein